MRPVIPFLTQGTPHPRGVFGSNLQLFCTVVFEWFLLILKQFDMKNEQNESEAGFRACLSQTGTKLIGNALNLHHPINILLASIALGPFNTYPSGMNIDMKRH